VVFKPRWFLKPLCIVVSIVMLIMLHFMPSLDSRVRLFWGRWQSDFVVVSKWIQWLPQRLSRPNSDVRQEPTVCQGCWCGSGGVGRWEWDDRGSNGVRVRRWSLLVTVGQLKGSKTQVETGTSIYVGLKRLTKLLQDRTVIRTERFKR